MDLVFSQNRYQHLNLPAHDAWKPSLQSHTVYESPHSWSVELRRDSRTQNGRLVRFRERFYRSPPRRSASDQKIPLRTGVTRKEIGTAYIHPNTPSLPNSKSHHVAIHPRCISASLRPKCVRIGPEYIAVEMYHCGIDTDFVACREVGISDFEAALRNLPRERHRYTVDDSRISITVAGQATQGKTCPFSKALSQPVLQR